MQAELPGMWTGALVVEAVIERHTPIAEAERRAKVEHANRVIGQLGRLDYIERQVERSMPPMEFFMERAAVMLRSSLPL